MPQFQGLRSLFGLDHTATAEELKKAYRKVSKKYHPDLNPTEEAKVQMQKITNAYDILTDPKKMEEYKREKGRTSTSSTKSRSHEKEENEK